MESTKKQLDSGPVHRFMQNHPRHRSLGRSASRGFTYVCEEAINILQVDSICLWLKGQQELHCEILVTKLQLPFGIGKGGQRRNCSREDILFGSHLANLTQQILSLDECTKTQSRLENRVIERTQELQKRTEFLRTAHQNIFMLGEISREIASQLDRDSIIQTLYQHVQKLKPAEFL